MLCSAMEGGKNNNLNTIERESCKFMGMIVSEKNWCMVYTEKVP